MALTPTEAIRHGAANMLGNWPTIGLRLGQTLVSTILVIATVAVVVLPLVSAATAADQTTRAQLDLAAIISQHWALAAGIVILSLLLLVSVLLLEAYVSAANAAIYIEGERAARAGAESGTATRYRVFQLRYWLDAGRASMWRVAGIYVSVAAMACLALAIVGTALSSLKSAPGPIGCCAIIVFIPVLLVAAILLAVCTTKAVIICVERTFSARESLREAWYTTTRQFWLHVWSACLIGVIAGGVSLMVSTLSTVLDIPSSLNQAWATAVVLAPLQIMVLVLQQAAVAASSCWFLASMTALTEVGIRESDTAGDVQDITIE